MIFNIYFYNIFIMMKVKKNNVSQTPKNSNLKKINFDRIKIENNNLKILEN
jgi:hypothetical protein